MMYQRKCGCQNCRPKWEKEYLGKRVSECKYYRVCCERFIEAPCKKDDCDNGFDMGGDHDCDCDHDCR